MILRDYEPSNGPFWSDDWQCSGPGYLGTIARRRSARNNISHQLGKMAPTTLHRTKQLKQSWARDAGAGVGGWRTMNRTLGLIWRDYRSREYLHIYISTLCMSCGHIIINSSSYTVGEGGVATFLSCPTQIPRVYVVMYLFWWTSGRRSIMTSPQFNIYGRSGKGIVVNYNLNLYLCQARPQSFEKIMCNCTANSTVIEVKKYKILEPGGKN